MELVTKSDKNGYSVKYFKIKFDEYRKNKMNLRGHFVNLTEFDLYLDIVNRLIGRMGKVFANGPGNLGSVLGRVIPKTLKIVLDTSLLNTQQ